MYYKLLKLTTLCFIIQLSVVNGLPTPNPDGQTKPADEAKAAVETAEKAAKDATSAVEKAATDAKDTADKAAKDATETAQKALEEVNKEIEEETANAKNGINAAVTAATDSAASTPQVTQEELATLLALLDKAAAAPGPNRNPLQNLSAALKNAPNPLGMLQSLISSLGPLSKMFETTIDGLTNIYLANRPHALEFSKKVTDPLLQLSSFAMTPFGLQETPGKLRSIGFKLGMDNTDNVVQAGNILASTAPTFMKHIERTGSGLIRMQSLNY